MKKKLLSSLLVGALTISMTVPAMAAEPLYELSDDTELSAFENVITDDEENAAEVEDAVEAEIINEELATEEEFSEDSDVEMLNVSTFKTAQEVAFGKSYTANYTTGTDGKNAFYKFTTTKNGIVAFNATKPTGAKGQYIELEITVMDLNENIISGTKNYRASLDTTMTNYNFSVCLKPGQYVFNIKYDSVVIDKASTTFSLTFTPQENLEVEPNETHAQATPIALNTFYTAFYGNDGASSKYDYHDYFSINLNAGTTYRFAFKDSPIFLKNNTAILNLENSAGKVVSYMDNKLYSKKYIDQKGNAYVDYTPTESGTYYLHLWNYSKEQYMYIFEVYADGSGASNPTKGDVTVRFKDVPTGKWFSKAGGPIQYVVDRGIMSGTGDGTTFEPNADCTRSQFVQILYNAEGKPYTDSANPFGDVANNAWYAKAVLWAYGKGITKGTTPSTFGPSVNVSREQVAQFLMNYASVRGFDTSARADISAYSDGGTTSGWASASVSWAVAKGLMSGYSDGRLAPKENCSRAQIAQMIMSFQQNVGK